MSVARTLFVVVFVASSAISPVVATSGPSGFVGLPDAAVQSEIPAHARDELPSADAFQGNIMATEGANTMQVTVTTQSAIRGKTAACQRSNAPGFCENPQLAIVFSDDTNHQSRRVAVPAAAVRDALGYVPGIAYVEHSSGEQYATPVKRQGSLLVFKLDRWSSNTVTFEGTVSIDATGAPDGSSYQYEVSSLDAVSNFTINVTGAVGTENETAVGTGAGTGTTAYVEAAGNLTPSGPASGSPELTLTGKRDRQRWTGYKDDNDNGVITHTFTDEPDRVTEVYIEKITNGWSSDRLELDITLSDGTNTWLLADNFVLNGGDVRSPTFTLDANVSGDVTIKTDVVAGDRTYGYSIGDPGCTCGGKIDIYSGYPTAANATVEGTTYDFGNLSGGASVTKAVSLSTGNNSLEFGVNDGAVDWTLNYTERQSTDDPAVGVNGNWYNYTGTLADGSTHAFDANTSDVQSGTNRVNVSVGDGSLSADAPTPQVNLDYHHTAKDDQSVSYDGEQWSERYNVSRTYSTKQTSAELTIPFDSGHVIEIRGIEKRINNSAWNAVADADYSLSGTTLTVDLGTVKNGATVDVRANGTKVSVTNGAITVLEATASGDSLDSKLRIDTQTDGFHIDVGGTAAGQRLHYTYEESWASPAEYALFTADGAQEIYLPNAGNGSTARVTTIPLTVAPRSGTVEIEVTNASATEPAWQVRPGHVEGDTVDYTLVEAKDGAKYSLYSRTYGAVRDDGTANSPLTLTDDSDNEEELEFRLESDGTSDDGGGGTGSGSFWADAQPVIDQAQATVEPLVNPAVVALLMIGLLGAAVWYTEEEKQSREVVYKRPLVLLAGIVAAFVGILLINPVAITDPLQTALTAALPLAAVLAVVGAAVWVYQRQQAKQAEASTPDNVFQINAERVGGSSDTQDSDSEGWRRWL